MLTGVSLSSRLVALHPSADDCLLSTMQVEKMDISFRLEAVQKGKSAALQIGDGPGNDLKLPVHEGVAFIAVTGMLMTSLPRWADGSNYYTGYNLLKEKLSWAFDSDAVKGICLCIDSPGGYVPGLMELVIWAGKRKAETKKTILSLVVSNAYSAAYAIASLGDKISVTINGGVGSIGIRTVHWDQSAAFERFGEKPTNMYSGARKTDRNSFEPLPEDVKARWQEDLDDNRKLFAEVVAFNRTAAGVSLSADDVLKTEADFYQGPSRLSQAIKLKLADQIVAEDEEVQRFITQINTGE